MKLTRVNAKHEGSFVDKNWFTLDNEAINTVREAASTPLTQGEMMLRSNCPRKWYYRYGMRIAKRGVLDFNLIYGSLMHRLLEALYSHKNAYSFPPDDFVLELTDEMMEEIISEYIFTPADYQELELTKAKVQIAFNAYRRLYYQTDSKLRILGVEKVLEYTFLGIDLAAKVDMIANPNRRDGVFIWDFKTQGRVDATSMDAWTFRFQFLFYCWMYWKISGTKPTGFMVNGLLKTGLRPKLVDRKAKRRESMEEYLLRIKGDYAVKREEYFYRRRIPLVTGALERFEHEILRPHIDAFRLLKDPDDFKDRLAMNALAFQMNTNHCHVYNSYCEYLSLCKDGRLALGEFDKRDTKHIELEARNLGIDKP